MAIAARMEGDTLFKGVSERLRRMTSTQVGTLWIDEIALYGE